MSEEDKGSLKWTDEEALPCRLLSGVTFIVLVIQLVAIGGKADYANLGLIILCFAPWLGHVIKGIRVAGIEILYATGSKPGPPTSLAEDQPTAGPPSLPPQPPPEPPTRPPSPSTPPSSPMPPLPAGVLRAIVSESFRTDPPFVALSADSKKLLATLWKYQKIYFPDLHSGVWTFGIFGPPQGDVLVYQRGLAALASHGFVIVTLNGQVGLTHEGIEYCLKHSSDLKLEPTWNKFSN